MGACFSSVRVRRMGLLCRAILLHEWAYVMWDHERLQYCGVFQYSWEGPDTQEDLYEQVKPLWDKDQRQCGRVQL